MGIGGPTGKRFRKGKRHAGHRERIDFLASRRHEGGMRQVFRESLTTFPCLLATALLTAGCTSSLEKKSPDSPATAASSAALRVTADADRSGAAKKGGFFSQLGNLPFLGRSRTNALESKPRRAQALRRIGTVRTLSNDGSYVIVELDPGILVSQGTPLIITATKADGETAKLKVAEVQFPYFVADVESGLPSPGDLVQQ